MYAFHLGCEKKNQLIYYSDNCFVYNSLPWLYYYLHKELSLR